MSRMLASRLDIDVLVHLVVRGPNGATEWRPLVPDGDDLGRQLWARNHSVARFKDQVSRDYVFTPVPVGVTAIEGLKQIAFYRYQTETDAPGPKDLREVLSHLQDALVAYLDGWEDAPWGWDQPDLVARTSRSPTEPANEPTAVTEVCRRWSDAGMPLAQVLVSRPEHHGFDARVVGTGHWWPRNESGFAALSVKVCVDVDAADAVLRDEIRSAIRYRRNSGAHVYRYEHVVVSRREGLPDGWEDEVVRHLPLLGVPDEHWWASEAPTATRDLVVLGEGIQLDPDRAGRHHHSDAIVATTPKELERLRELVVNPAALEALDLVNIRQKSIILVRGLSELRNLEQAEVHPDPDGGLRLYVRAGHASSMRGTLLVLDRLDSQLAVLQVDAPDNHIEVRANQA